jgi:CRP-like cAMP-binding protein
MNLQPAKNSDISLLTAVLSNFFPINRSIEEYLSKHVQPCFFKKGELLLKQGDICLHVYFIQKGLIRGFFKEGKKDITTWITAEYEMVTSIAGLTKREPTEENIQAIEDCNLLAISFADLENMYLLFPEFNIVIRKLLQQYYSDAEGRAFIARITNAEKKYRHFNHKYYHLVNRVPLKYIASFLGVTIETLSRVRKKISIVDRKNTSV